MEKIIHLNIYFCNWPIYPGKASRYCLLGEFGYVVEKKTELEIYQIIITCMYNIVCMYATLSDARHPDIITDTRGHGLITKGIWYNLSYPLNKCKYCTINVFRIQSARSTLLTVFTYIPIYMFINFSSYMDVTLCFYFAVSLYIVYFAYNKWIIYLHLLVTQFIP